MTKIYLLFGLLLSGGAIFAQHLPNGWITSAGGVISSECGSLTYALGGVLGQTLECDGFYLQREMFIAETPALTTQVERPSETAPYAFYPNPVQNVLHLRSEKPTRGILHIHNVYGNTILASRRVNFSQPIDLTDLPAGIYQLKFYPESTQEAYAYKLIKQ